MPFGVIPCSMIGPAFNTAIEHVLPTTSQATTPEVSAADGRKTNYQQLSLSTHKEPIMRKYQISIQRRQGDGRWKELFAWEVITLEGQKDQESALNVGLREGWRAKVAEVAKRPQAPHGVPDVSPGANNQPGTSNW